MTSLQRPPIPQAPLVDQHGFVTREWWRWFAAIGVVVGEQGGEIGTVRGAVESAAAIDAPLAPLDDPVDPAEIVRQAAGLDRLQDAIDAADIVRQSLALRLLQDALSTTVDPDQAALSALALTLPQDPLALDQAAIEALSLTLPADVYVPGRLRGINTSAGAEAGCAGEFISSRVTQASAVALVTATAADVTSISLTPGEWDVFGVVGFVLDATTTLATIEGWTSATSATGPSADNQGGRFVLTLAFTNGALQVMPVGSKRFALDVTTTVYLGCRAAFGVANCKGFGFIGARRRA